MKFKRVRYDSGENIVRIRIEDETRRLMDSWTLMMSDLPQWVNSIRNKYGIDFNKKPKDLEWLR